MGINVWRAGFNGIASYQRVVSQVCRIAAAIPGNETARHHVGVIDSVVGLDFEIAMNRSRSVIFGASRSIAEAIDVGWRLRHILRVVWRAGREHQGAALLNDGGIAWGKTRWDGSSSLVVEEDALRSALRADCEVPDFLSVVFPPSSFLGKSSSRNCDLYWPLSSTPAASRRARPCPIAGQG